MVKRRAQFILSGLIIVTATVLLSSCTTTQSTQFERAELKMLLPGVSVSEEMLVSVEQAHPGTFRFCTGSDGDRYAFARQRGDTWIVVLDGKEGEAFDQLSETVNVFIPDRLYPGFSKDCSRFAYAGRRAGKWHLVVNEEVEPGSYDTEPTSILRSFDEVTPRISPVETTQGDVRIVEKNGERYVVLNGKELKHYSVGAKGGLLEATATFVCAPAQTDCSFTADGPMYPIYRDMAQNRIGYQVRQKSGIIYVIDEVEYGPYEPTLYDEHGGPVIFSPNSQHFAFQAMRDGRAIMNVNGVDLLSTQVLRYREPGVLVSSEMTFPYQFLDSNQLQTYAIEGNRLLRLIIDVGE